MTLRLLASWLVVWVLLPAQPSVSADTGFLDRPVTIGGVIYRYQVYVPADYSRARTWPVLVDLHGNGAQGSDGLIQTIRGMAEQIRRDRSRFPAIVVFPQAPDGKRWFEADKDELVIAELDQVMAEFRGDPARVALAQAMWARRWPRMMTRP